MRDPFKIDGPAVISFSGGRTSGYMLRRVLDAGLQADVRVVFSNTGKERLETLDFVAECGKRWDVPITWVEKGPAGFRICDRSTASTEGQPFSDLITARKYLPNPVTRYCTSELKIRPMRDFMRSVGHADDTWTNVVGIRGDEPRRAARMKDRNNEGKWDVAMPLYDAGITLADVTAFWTAQPFDLALQPWEGNCDLCFLKSTNRRLRVIEDRPALADWWIAQEAKIGKTFRIDTPSYARLAQSAKNQMRLPLTEACDLDGIADCFCG
jgi:hypothetical protein